MKYAMGALIVVCLGLDIYGIVDLTKPFVPAEYPKVRATLLNKESTITVPTGPVQGMQAFEDRVLPGKVLIGDMAWPVDGYVSVFCELGQEGMATVRVRGGKIEKVIAFGCHEVAVQ